MYECETCDGQFGSDQARARHMNAYGHWARWECEGCGVELYDEYEYHEHLDYYNHYTPQHKCEACDEKFFTPQQARLHMDGHGHWRTHWCAVCKRGFQNENNLRMHNGSREHLAHFPYKCEGCNTRYTTFAGIRQHMNEKNHWREHFCQTCQQGFQNANALKQHLHGAAHYKDSIACPFCKKTFTAASGVAHHLETASCPRAANLNRESIYKAINARDTSGIITNKLLTWDDSANQEWTATAASWNGHAYECYLCHRGFASCKVLNQHLASLIHKQKLYRCFGGRCGKEFVSLAALFGHLESESCGAVRFGNVQRSANNILSGQRRIAF